MRAIDIFMRILALAPFFASLVLEGPQMLLIISFTFFAMGLWSVIYPPGVIGWAKTAYPSVDPSNESLWAVPRFIGVCFIILSVFLVAATSSF